MTRSQGHRSGERHPRSRLSDDVVDQIRSDYHDHDMTYAAIGDKYATSKWTIRDICTYKTRNKR
jgi:hypothetical protein